LFPEIRRINRDVITGSMSKISWNLRGKVCDVIGTMVEAKLSGAKLGTLVEIGVESSSQKVLAEVVGFREERVLLLPYGEIQGIAAGCTVARKKILDLCEVGDHLLGRVIDPFGRAIDSLPAWDRDRVSRVPVDKTAPNPLERKRIREPLGLGVRAIDGLMTFGNGQRMGIMAGSGVGKSVLLGMIAKDTEADINVIALIGERGREVREFIERDLGEEGLKRSIVVTVTSDQSPLMKIRAAKVATAIAEYFSCRGKNVLLMMDSLTRVAMAQREIGLAVGEPPTTKGYTPSVFSLLPKLLERSGPQIEGHGNISALYTVLVDGDDFNDPIADAARSILDGHLNLSRRLAARGHYPAIDITTSASRVMADVVPKEHQKMAGYIKSLMANFLENYEPGANPVLDEALALMPRIEGFLKQDADEHSSFSETLLAMRQVLSALPQRNQNNELAS
jgi:flagellum-specific ATP synthase